MDLAATWALSPPSGLRQVWARIGSDNAASARVAAGAGFRLLATAGGGEVWARTDRRADARSSRSRCYRACSDREAGPVRPARTGRTPALAERERRTTPPYGGVFVARTQVMDADDVRRAIWRMAHEIIERNHGLDDVVLDRPADRRGRRSPSALAEALERDRRRPRRRSARSTSPSTATTSASGRCCPRRSPTSPSTSTARIVVLVDDVLFTGRTIRAALDALNDYGRPRAVQLAVMVDRGHRELPIRPDYVGKNLPTRRDEVVDVSADGRRPRRDGEVSEAPPVDRRPRRATTSSSCSSSPTPSSRSAGARIPKVPALRGKTVVWLFYEDSTRTRLSFETGGQAALGRHHDLQRRLVVGEEGRVAARHRRDHRGDGRRRHRRAPRARPACRWQIARWVDAAVINAGDGWHEHPTQALLDCYTIREHLGGLDGLHIAIVGDIKHSRVARSDVLAFTALGRRGHAGGAAHPAAARASRAGRCEVSHDLDAVLPDVDVVYLLRMQRERMTEALVPSLREYTARYGLTRAPGRRCCGDDALVMHPGPMNRGVEIAAEVADLPRVGDHRPGAQRRRRAHGGAVPAARRGRRQLGPST